MVSSLRQGGKKKRSINGFELIIEMAKYVVLYMDLACLINCGATYSSKIGHWPLGKMTGVGSVQYLAPII